MAIKKYLHKSQKLLKKSQEKLNEIKEKIENLKQQEVDLESKGASLKKIRSEKEGKDVTIHISFSSVIQASLAVLLVVGLAWILFTIKGTIIKFLVALFLSATLSTPVDWLEKHKIPRSLGVLIMYIFILGFLTLFFSLLGPLIANQVTALANSVTDIIQNVFVNQSSDSWISTQLQPFLNQIAEGLDQKELLSSVTDALSSVGSTLKEFAGKGISAIFSIFNGIANFALVLVLTFFMTLRSHDSNDFFHSLFPKKYSTYISEKMRQMSIRIGEWVRGQFLLALIMGILTFIVFKVSGLNYALTIGVIAGVAEFVPYLGPIVTYAVAALIGINQSVPMFLWVTVVQVISQFLENNILVPLVMGKSVGLSPVVILFSLLAGAALGYQLGDESLGMGLVGMILAVPVANILSIFVEDYTQRNKQ